jgi:hypothetical protein
VIGLCAVGAADIRVGIVHGVLVAAIVGIRVHIASLSSSRRGQGLLCWGLPAHGRHVWATVGTRSTTGLVMVGGRGRLQDRRWSISIGVGCDSRTLGAYIRGIRLRRQGRGGTRAGLGHLVTEMRRHGHVTMGVHVVRVLTVHSRHDTSRHASSGGQRHGPVGRRGGAHLGSRLGELIGIGTACPARGGGSGSKSCSSCSGSFLDCASVMVLMTR